MVIYPMNHKNNDQICDSGLFLQNALVEYIGVYSDTNDQFFARLPGFHFEKPLLSKQISHVNVFINQ